MDSSELEYNEETLDKYVSKKQACELLGVCNATGWKLFKKHKVESILFGNSNTIGEIK